MAFKVTKPIYTDKGETSEAYIRFSRYDVQKNGDVTFFIEMFLSDQEVLDAMPTPNNPNACKNAQIGDMIYIHMTKQLTVKTKSKKIIETPVAAVLDEDGLIITPATKTYTEQEIEEDTVMAVPDMTPLTNGTIFAFAYEKLREKLVDLYGADYVVEC